MHIHFDLAVLNWLAIVLATASAFVLGGIWYGPLFGKQWMAEYGFSEEDLTVQREGNQLVISGKRQTEDEGRVFIHRGIAARQFHRSFLLAEGIEIEEASMDNGLLNVDVFRPLPEPEIQKIKIRYKTRFKEKRS